MTMPRRVATLLLIAVLLLAGGLALGSARVAYGQDPTIPTRTPTPDPNAQEPTVPSASSTPDDGGNNPPPPPPPAEVTATATATTAALPLGPTYTATATTAPVEGVISPAVAARGCSDDPYAQAIQQVIVYAGPGKDYAALAVLQPEETRPIAGRAGYATWWQVRMSDTLLGWVPDEEVNEFGNTGKAPVVEPMAINGSTPTPGAPWEPTPLPYVPCEETPTPTPSPASTATATATPEATTASATQMAMVSSSISNDQDAGGAGDAAAGAQVVLPQPEGSTVGKQGTASAAGLESSGGVSPAQVILPLAGLVLVAAGVVVALLSRKPAVTGGTIGPKSES